MRDIFVGTADHKSIFIQLLSQTRNEARAETSLLVNNFKVCLMSRKLGKFAFVKTFFPILFIVVLHNNSKFVFPENYE
jgi:hypothetical protein